MNYSSPVLLVSVTISRAGKSTKFMYLSKSTNKATQVEVKVEVQVKSKQLFLEYIQKYFHRPKNDYTG